MTYYIYILASQRNGTLYIGVTNNLLNRVKQHREKKNQGFTKRYHVNMLVYYEEFQYIYDALAREKQLKNWRRLWKLDLIEQYNPGWHDLYEIFTGS
ncbi:MAG: GIY-YIG nuclease family protein [Pseudomonadota bacterium]